MRKLKKEETEVLLKKVKGWKLEKNSIVREWKFKNFFESMNFINKVAEISEIMDHHAEIYNVYNKVSLRYSTHDVKGLSIKDFEAAAAVNKIKI